MPKPETNEIILSSGASAAALPTPDKAPTTNEHYEAITGQPLPDGSPTSENELALVFARSGRHGYEFVETFNDEEFLKLYAIMTIVHPTIVRRLAEKVQLEQARLHREEVDARFNGLAERSYGYTKE